MTPFFSIIVPVYNVENYLDRCLNSILSQNFLYFELLLIDDGSTDSSGMLCDQYAEKDSRIKVFHKKNGGLSSARNFGLKRASGNYVWFIDSDDSINEFSLQKLSDFIKETNADFIEFSLNEIYPKNDLIIPNFNNKPSNIVNSIEYIKYYRIPQSICCTISKLNIWIENKLEFIEGIIHEDYDAIIRLVEKCEKIIFYTSTEGLYNYYIGRTGSITTERGIERDRKSLYSYLTIIENFALIYPKTENKQTYSYWINIYWLNNIKAFFLATLLRSKMSLDEKYIYLSPFDEKLFFIEKRNSKLRHIKSLKLHVLSQLLFKHPQLYKIALKLF